MQCEAAKKLYIYNETSNTHGENFSEISADEIPISRTIDLGLNDNKS